MNGFSRRGFRAWSFCRNLKPAESVIQMATRYQIPLLLYPEGTCGFMNKAIRVLQAELAPRISIHGVLVDVFGEGVLIIGESGIGKSEAALELIKRGHRLVSDDVVEIKKSAIRSLWEQRRILPGILSNFGESVLSM